MRTPHMFINLGRQLILALLAKVCNALQRIFFASEDLEKQLGWQKKVGRVTCRWLAGDTSRRPPCCCAPWRPVGSRVPSQVEATRPCRCCSCRRRRGSTARPWTWYRCSWPFFSPVRHRCRWPCPSTWPRRRCRVAGVCDYDSSRSTGTPAYPRTLVPPAGPGPGCAASRPNPSSETGTTRHHRCHRHHHHHLGTTTAARLGRPDNAASLDRPVAVVDSWFFFNFLWSWL